MSNSLNKEDLSSLKDDLNLLRKNLQELLEVINLPKRDYNKVKNKIDVLNNALNPLLQYTCNQQEDNVIKLFAIIYGLTVSLQNFEKQIKPIEEKTENFTFKVLTNFFNTSPKIPPTTQQAIIHLISSSNLLKAWLKKNTLLEDEEQLKPTRPSHNVQ